MQEFLSGRDCPYCDPIRHNAWHTQERIAVFFFPVTKFLISTERKIRNRFPTFFYHANKFFLNGILRILTATSVLRETEITDDTGIPNRTLVFIEAARQKDVKVKALKLFGRRTTNFFSVLLGGEKKIFEVLPHQDIHCIQKIEFDDKGIFKEMLKSNQFPCADGGCFSTPEPALVFARQKGFPVIVKPRSSSLSKHVTCHIYSTDELREAIRIAQIIDKDFIVEEHIQGHVYRITLVGHKVVACCLREPPNVCGDGVHTVQELIRQKNSHPWREAPGNASGTLRKIAIISGTRSLLARQGLSLESIPSPGQKVSLHNKVILACGADIHDKTDEMHPDTVRMFESISILCQSWVIGIDFICPNIAQSYPQQKCAVLEANSLPYIDMHHYPVSGTPRDVGGAIVAYLLRQNDSLEYTQTH